MIVHVHIVLQWHTTKFIMIVIVPVCIVLFVYGVFLTMIYITAYMYQFNITIIEYSSGLVMPHKCTI